MTLTPEPMYPSAVRPLLSRITCAARFGLSLGALLSVSFPEEAHALAPCVSEPLGDHWVHVSQRFHAGAPLSARPLVTAAGNVFVGTHDGYLHALSSQGAFLWSYTVEGALLNALASDGARVYAASSLGKIYSLGEDGHPIWTFLSPITPDTGLVYSSKKLVFFGERDSLYAVSTRAGLLWQAPLFAKIADGPRVDAQGRAWVITQDGKLHRIQSPGVRRGFSLPQAADYSIVRLSGQPQPSTTALVRVGHSVIALDAEGLQQFRVEGVQHASPAAGQSWVAVTTIAGRSELAWYEGSLQQRSAQLEHTAGAPPLVDADWVFVVGPRGELTVHHLGAQFSCRLGAAPLFQPVSDGFGGVWIAAGDGNLFALSRSPGAQG